MLEERPDHPEAHGGLGRIHKDAWRAMWSGVDDLDERRLIARRSAAQARLAIRSYRRAHRRDLESYYNGINVVGLMQLARAPRGAVESGGSVADRLEDLIAVVRIAATVARQRAYDAGAESEVVWPASTLGELELLVGDQERAIELYLEAVSAPGATLFQLESMLTQLALYAELGLRADAAREVGGALEPMRKHVAQPAARHDQRGCLQRPHDRRPGPAGHAVPAGAGGAVRDAHAPGARGRGRGPGTLAIGGGARGADIIFGELARRAGSRPAHAAGAAAARDARAVRQASRRRGWVGGAVPSPGRARRGGVQSERLGDPPAGMDVFSRTNLWILDTARVEAAGRASPPILVWDEQPTGDGPGGTSDFAEKAERMSSRFAIVNPMKLEDAR